MTKRESQVCSFLRTHEKAYNIYGLPEALEHWSAFNLQINHPLYGGSTLHKDGILTAAEQVLNTGHSFIVQKGQYFSLYLITTEEKRTRLRKPWHLCSHRPAH